MTKEEIKKSHRHCSWMRNYYLEIKHDYNQALEWEEKRDEIERKYPELFPDLPF